MRRGTAYSRTGNKQPPSSKTYPNVTCQQFAQHFPASSREQPSSNDAITATPRGTNTNVPCTVDASCPKQPVPNTGRTREPLRTKCRPERIHETSSSSPDRCRTQRSSPSPKHGSGQSCLRTADHRMGTPQWQWKSERAQTVSPHTRNGTPRSACMLQVRQNGSASLS